MDKKQRRTEILGGPQAEIIFEVIFDLAHRYARASSAPLGTSVFDWLAKQNERVIEAWSSEDA